MSVAGGGGEQGERGQPRPIDVKLQPGVKHIEDGGGHLPPKKSKAMLGMDMAV